MSSDEITIPTEILHDILHLLCDEPIALHDLKNKSHFHKFPWAVGQVCRHWRRAFLSYTHLWTSFTLKPGHFDAAYFVEMNRRAAIYLERSREQPLTIAVYTPCSYTEKFPKTVWRMLLSCLKRWEKANLVLWHGAARNELLRCRGYMSSLKSLRMYIPRSTALKHNNAFEVAPHLTELDLDHRGYTATWQFPWARLMKLKIETSTGFHHSYGNNLCGILFQLENIEELHIIEGLIIVTTSRHISPPSSLPITCLRSLRLLEIAMPFAMMFSCFTAPVLEQLHIHGGYNNVNTHGRQPYERELKSLIQRSSCHLRRLVLERCTTTEMRKMMKKLASVEELSINYFGPHGSVQDVNHHHNLLHPKPVFLTSHHMPS